MLKAVNDTIVTHIIKGVILQSKPATTKNGKSYTVLNIADEASKHTVYIWNSESKQFQPGKLITVNAKESDGMFSATKGDTTIQNLSKDSVLYKLFSSLTPVPSIEEWQDLIKKIESLITDPQQSQWFSFIASKLYGPYSHHTAARANHHAYIGGLAQHTYELLNMFIHLYPSLPYKVDPFIVTIACLFHDYGKLSEYTQELEYQDSFFLQGHPFLSAEALGQFLRSKDAPQQLIKHCQHAVLSHHQRLEWGSPVLPCTPEAYLVSMLDALSGTGVQYNQPTGTKACGTTIQRY